MKTVTIKEVKEGWKEELEKSNTDFTSIITDLISLEKKTNDSWKTAIMLCLADGITTVKGWEKAANKAATNALELEYNRLVAKETDPVAIASLKLEFYHNKDTAQHKAGTIKTSRLPVAWRSSVSTIKGGLNMKVSLTRSILAEDGKTIIGYEPQPKSELTRLTRLAVERAAKDGEPSGVTPDEVSIVDEVSNVLKEKELTPLATLEILIQSCKSTIAKIDDGKDLEQAKLLVDSLWNLEPIKIAV